MAIIISNSQQFQTAAQVRKIKKPMIERKRRDRINESLNQLKTLVLEAMHKDESRYTKMEKADILEMTVSYLQSRCQSKRTSRNSNKTPCAPTTPEVRSLPQSYATRGLHDTTNTSQLPGTKPSTPCPRENRNRNQNSYYDSAIPLYADSHSPSDSSVSSEYRSRGSTSSSPCINQQQNNVYTYQSRSMLTSSRAWRPW